MGILNMFKSLLGGGGVETISPTDALAKLGEGVLLIDVREPSELKADGKVAAAKNIPLGQVSADRLPQDLETPIMFMCRSGARSGMAASKAKGLGYTQVFNVAGGIMGWKASGTPLK